MFYLHMANDCVVAALRAALLVCVRLTKAVKEICGDTMNATMNLGLKS
jgi:hypothetical protein